MRNHNHDSRAIALGLAQRGRLPQHSLLDAPNQRMRHWALALVVLMIALSVYLFISTNQLFDRFQDRLAGVEDSDAARIRQYNEKLESLQNRMTVFVADSVENKLRTLEKNVADGTVGTQEIRTLEELKGEVRLLETYSAGKRANLTDPARFDHARFQAIPASANNAAGGDLLYEVSQMKRLLYFSIASCGLVGLMLGGYWWQTAGRAKRLPNPISQARLLAAKSPEE